MPFLSLLTNSATNFGLTGNALRGATARAIYKFVPSPFGGYFGQTNTLPAVPSSIKETNEGFNDQTFMFYVNGINSAGRPLYWKIKHITTTDADFQATSGFFGSNNWGNNYAGSLSFQYLHEYGEELGRFGIDMVADGTTEGNETFQVEIREHPTLDPVLTSSVITVQDTSAPSFSFDINSYQWQYAIQNGLDEWTSYELLVNATNISTFTDTYVYYTFIGPGGNSLDLNTFTQDRYQQSLPTGQIYIYPTQYYENGEFKNRNYGWGRFYVSPRNDYLTEGPETFQIQLRTGSTSGLVVATSPVLTINDISNASSPRY